MEKRFTDGKLTIMKYQNDTRRKNTKLFENDGGGIPIFLMIGSLVGLISSFSFHFAHEQLRENLIPDPVEEDVSLENSKGCCPFHRWQWRFCQYNEDSTKVRQAVQNIKTNTINKIRDSHLFVNPNTFEMEPFDITAFHVTG
jgi:hypothetical protein